MLEAKTILRELVKRENSTNKLVSFNIVSGEQSIKPGQSMYVSDRHVFTPFPSLERPTNSQSLYHLFIPKPIQSAFKPSSRDNQPKISRSMHKKHRSDLINDTNASEVFIINNPNQRTSTRQLQSSGQQSIFKRETQYNSARQTVHGQQSKHSIFSKSKRNVRDFQSHDKIKEKKQAIPRKQQKQRKKILVNKQQKEQKKQGCFSVKMTTIPFNISKKNYRQFISKGLTKEKQETNQPIKEESVKQVINNEEEMKKMILTRQEQLRNKLMRQILAGSKMGIGNQKHFISYFPHTDYELALKEYLNRQEAKQQKGKFCSETFLRMSEEIKEEQIKIALKRAVRRESCFVFTEFNRKKYELSITREELIDRVIKAKNSQEITGVLLDRIQEKIVNLGYKKRSTEYDQCHDGYFNERNLHKVQVEDNKKLEDLSIKCIGSQQYGENNHAQNVRISMIAPVDFNRNQSDKNIFTELIASMGNNLNKSQSSLSQNSIHKIKTQRTQDKSVKNRLTSQRIQTKMKENDMKQKRFHTLRPQMKKTAPIQSNLHDIKAKKTTEKGSTINSTSAKKDKILPKINENKKTSIPKSRQIIKNDGFKLKKIKTTEMNKLIKQQQEKMEIKIEKISQMNIEQSNMIINTAQQVFNAFQSVQNLVFKQQNYYKPQSNEMQSIKEITITSDFLFLSIFPVAKFHQAFTILSLIANQYLLQQIEKQRLYMFGQWITPVLKLPHLDSSISNISAQCLSICKLAQLELQISLSELTLQQILKMMTGHRIIWFRNKSTTEREVAYHHSKGHHVVFVSKKENSLGVLEKIEEASQGKLYKMKKIGQQHSIYLVFQQLIEEMDIVSINKRINCIGNNWGCFDSQIEEGKDQIISILAPITTKGTVTVYFPQMQGKVVELILQKIGSDYTPQVQQKVKEIGKVEEKLRYDNIYFEFSIHGTYRLRIRVRGIFVQNCRISYETTEKISMKIDQ